MERSENKQKVENNIQVLIVMTVKVPNVIKLHSSESDKIPPIDRIMPLQTMEIFHLHGKCYRIYYIHELKEQ